MVRVEVHLRGGSVMEVEDFDLFKIGPMHKPSGIEFASSEKARQYVPYLDFEEVVAVKVTDFEGEDTGEG